MVDTSVIGPVDFLVVEFDGRRMTGEGIPILLDLVNRGIIRVLDLAFMVKEPDGTVRGLALEEVPAEARQDYAVFEGASSGLLGEDDLKEVGKAVDAGNTAGILIYENVWAAPFAAALRRGGAELVASGRIPMPTLLAAISPN